MVCGTNSFHEPLHVDLVPRIARVDRLALDRLSAGYRAAEWTARQLTAKSSRSRRPLRRGGTPSVLHALRVSLRRRASLSVNGSVDGPDVDHIGQPLSIAQPTTPLPLELMRCGPAARSLWCKAHRRLPTPPVDGAG